MKKIIQILIIVLPIYDCLSQSTVSKRDADEIRALARKRVEKDFPDLMNTLNLDDLGEFERKTLIQNSYLLNNNQVFYSDGTIVEDDLNPNRNETEKPIDLPIGKYLNNFDLFYTKSMSTTFEVNNIVVSEVKNTDDIVFVKVYFTSTFLGLHKTIKKTFSPQLRVAELRAVKSGKKWETFISRIAFYKPEQIEPNVKQDTALKNPNELSKHPSVVTEKVVSNDKGNVISQIPESSNEVHKMPILDSLLVTNSTTKSIQTDSIPVADDKLQVFDFDNLNKKLVDYRFKHKALKILSLGSVIGGVLTFVLTSSNLKVYNEEIEQNNQAYSTWHSTNGLGNPPPDELANPISLSEFAPPSILAIGTLAATGIGLFIWSGKYGKLVKETQSQLDNIRKNTSFVPQFDIINQKMGFLVTYKF